MNSKTFLTFIALACIIAIVSAQETTTADPIASLQSKASSVAATASNTSPTAAATTTSTSAGFSLNSGLSVQLLASICAIAASFLW
ncbi:uncharacterized protein BX663DRAFT_549169 [Cokeromyces recurvatus]|uniref:uncharacterized protein n=1 Tax=Cokeromyces recurvatus TaxID=90255 RepID=UPI00221F6FD4|nr:uncharacterized protein BX663DRAFT_549169 [Cokeromyces recurvatus]KAI7906051.1 hypothetical protein BX663DRAFT_549169 [Cokeromyces recurvatus]